MAEIAKRNSVKENKKHRVIITAINGVDEQERYCICNGLRVPLETPVELTEFQIRVIKRQQIMANKRRTKVESAEDIKHRLKLPTINEARRLLAENREMFEKETALSNKYSVERL